MISVEGYEELNKIIIDNNDKQIMLYFGATWCGPCMMLKEKIQKEKDEIKDLVVVYIDCDCADNEDILDQYKVTALPTQIFVHLDDNKVINDDTIEGYDWIQLLMKYNELCGKSENNCLISSADLNLCSLVSSRRAGLVIVFDSAIHRRILWASCISSISK